VIKKMELIRLVTDNASGLKRSLEKALKMMAAAEKINAALERG